MVVQNMRLGKQKASSTIKNNIFNSLEYYLKAYLHAFQGFRSINCSEINF